MSMKYLKKFKNIPFGLKVLNAVANIRNYMNATISINHLNGQKFREDYCIYNSSSSTIKKSHQRTHDIID